ncbi:MAG: hypothetical protein PWP27_867 [Clostridiales bacterium]|jgi:uncharacterized membrane protein YbjE (DUF340 family)|nr:hypothetical protein [Clostridiales bacterium]MDK2933057.1 hypothetical protein [Clostridiales bacterium]
MTYIILGALTCGILSGYFFLPESIISNIGTMTSFALNLLILSVGIDLGYNKEVFYDLRKAGFKILLVPLAIVLGSTIGGIIAGFIYKMPLNVSLGIASGFGWYSLSGVLLSELSNVKIGTVAFLTNVFREIIALIMIPILAQKLNHFTAIAPAGATSMDSTLPVIAEATDQETVVISFINGAVLSALVPILVPLFYSIKI